MRVMNGRIGVLFLALSSLTVITAMADEVRLRNGDRLSGEVIRMEDRKLILKTSYAGEVSIDWGQITYLVTKEPITVVLRDKTTLKGVSEVTQEGEMKLKVVEITQTIPLDLAQIRSINPKPIPSVILTGHANAGASVAKGNTDTETYHMDADLVARTAKNRYTVSGQFNEAKDTNQETANNALLYMKYDHFLNKEWFFFTNASFEKDKFKDLNLRTVVGAGAGYQFLETALTNLSGEAGLSWVNEDFDVADDKSYPAGRWAVNFNRYFLDKAVQFFHFHEGFVGFEDTKDIFIRSRTGVRIPIYDSLKATAQYNLDWDNLPSPGRDKVDQMYILTIGYEWELPYY